MHPTDLNLTLTTEPTEPPWRPWHPVAGARDRFGWVLGLQVALAFAGPAVVAHLGGLSVSDGAVLSLAGLVFVLLASSLAPGRSRLPYGVVIALALGAAGIVASLVTLRSPAGVVVVVVAAAATALAPALSAGFATAVRAFALALVVLMAVTPSGHVTVLLVVGALVALALSEVVRLLAHPRLPLLPLPAVAPPTPFDRGAAGVHAARLAIAVGLGAALVVAAGTGSPFASHASWVIIGVWVALRPHHHLTRDLAVQRAVGTVLGAAVTVAVVATFPSSQWLGWVLVPLVFVAFGLRSVNYAWYCVAVTPVLVVGFTGTHVDSEVLTARIVWTVVGVAIAYAAARLIRPTTAAPGTPPLGRPATGATRRPGARPPAPREG